jgi:DNA-binding XRE family transcriptional regulator
MSNAAKSIEPKASARRQGAPTKRIGISGPRRVYELTQTDIATAMGVSQARISEIEATTGDAIEVRTLRAYAEAAGFTLEICFTRDNLRMRVM